jgi:transposase InsO family protein
VGTVAWRTTEVREQRVRFVVRASENKQSLTELCKEFGISRPTGYRWLERYHKHGVLGIEELSRRPKHSPRASAEQIVEQVLALRKIYPDWGARKLQVLLERQGVPVAVRTVHRILKRNGCVDKNSSHSHATSRFERSEPNQLWQMDFKSPKGWNSHVGPLSVLDDHSRYLIRLFATGTTRLELVREQLEAAFSECGVPDAMLMDHGTPWWNPEAPSGWTRLSVWLMRQGIRLYYSGIRHPQTQGKVERFHAALEMARRKRGLPDKEHHQDWLDQFRQEYNQVRPHQALQWKVPADLWRPSLRRYNPNPGDWTYPEGAELARLSKFGQLKLINRWWQVSEALPNELIQLIRIGHRVQLYYCQTLIREIDLAEGRSTAVERPSRLFTCNGSIGNIV